MRVKVAGKVSESTGAVLWSRAVSVSAESVGRTVHSAWYDHGFYKVPVIGELDLGKIRSALHKKFYKPSFGKFGGGLSLGDVWDAGDGHIFVEHVYHIGD